MALSILLRGQSNYKASFATIGIAIASVKVEKGDREKSLNQGFCGVFVQPSIAPATTEPMRVFFSPPMSPSFAAAIAPQMTHGDRGVLSREDSIGYPLRCS
ncbi:MAG: hypothetical protein J7647_27880 [Cyanobacteria bacterium SBLK]|nr:hypothetical protein [Cyanobacteria bacterium SBLK]